LAAGLVRDVGARALKLRQIQEELYRRGEWALNLDRTVKERDAVIRQLQSELEDRTRWALELDRTVREQDHRMQEMRSKVGRKAPGTRNEAGKSGNRGPIGRLFRNH